MSIKSDLGNSITGNVESAYLIIKDWRKRADESLDESTTQDYLTHFLKMYKHPVPSKNSNVDKRFKVQFNPNELQIYVSNLKSSQQDAQRNEDGTQKTVVKPIKIPTVELALNLIFDHVNNYDAFMSEKMTMGATASGITNVTSAISTASKKGKVWTVQTEVEGLLAALYNPYTRFVTFQWAKFSFSGLIKNVSANYTMFSVSGRPIRAQVQLRIHQNDYERLLHNWYDDFDTAFFSKPSDLRSEIGEPLTNSSYVRTEDKVGNILNVGL